MVKRYTSYPLPPVSSEVHSSFLNVTTLNKEKSGKKRNSDVSKWNSILMQREFNIIVG